MRLGETVCFGYFEQKGMDVTDKVANTAILQFVKETVEVGVEGSAQAVRESEVRFSRPCLCAARARLSVAASRAHPCDTQSRPLNHCQTPDSDVRSAWHAHGLYVQASPEPRPIWLPLMPWLNDLKQKRRRLGEQGGVRFFR